MLSALKQIYLILTNMLTCIFSTKCMHTTARKTIYQQQKMHIKIKMLKVT